MWAVVCNFLDSLTDFCAGHVIERIGDTHFPSVNFHYGSGGTLAFVPQAYEDVVLPHGKRLRLQTMFFLKVDVSPLAEEAAIDKASHGEAVCVVVSDRCLESLYSIGA